MPSWRLNERHYGALQGLDKAETAAKYGDEQVLVWRRSYDTPPNPLDAGRSARPASPTRATPALDRADIPLTECLKDTVARVLPYWNEKIAPAIRAGKRVLITAHGNSLRALVKHLDGIGDDEIVGLNVPTGATARLRARRRPQADRQPLSRRRGADRGGDGGGRRAGQGQGRVGRGGPARDESRGAARRRRRRALLRRSRSSPPAVSRPRRSRGEDREGRRSPGRPTPPRSTPRIRARPSANRAPNATG